MDFRPNLRKLYQPVQPTVHQWTPNVQYVEFLPHPKLQDCIYCYWQLKTTRKLSESFIYRVVADGCIDIYFELRNPDESFVMGFCKKSIEFHLEEEFNYVGIRFLPTMFPQLFEISALELSNRFEYLKLILPELSKFISANFEAKDEQELIQAKLDEYFVSLTSNQTFDFDSRLYGALEIILKNFGVLNVESDLDTGISARQLRRLFEFYVGTSAKTFSQVVRFQNVLLAKPSSQSLKQCKLFIGNGYYDQSHFIKEFKNFYGLTPSKAFKW